MQSWTCVIISVKWSFRNPSYADLLLKKDFLLWSVLKLLLCWLVCLWKPWRTFFRVLWWKLKLSIEYWKDRDLLEIRIFCNIIHVFNVTFNQFNAFLLDTSSNIYIFKSYLHSNVLIKKIYIFFIFIFIFYCISFSICLQINGTDIPIYKQNFNHHNCTIFALFQ